MFILLNRQTVHKIQNIHPFSADVTHANLQKTHEGLIFEHIPVN